MKRIMRMGMAALILAAATGCGQKEMPSQTEEAGIVLTISLPEAEWSGCTDGLTALYRKEHPEVEAIEWNLVDRSMYGDLLGVNLVSQNLPDIISVGNQASLETWREHLVVLNEAAVEERFPAEYLKPGRMDGSLYALPILIQAKGILYNTELLAGQGIAKIPETRSELEALCQTLEEAEIKPIMNHYKETLLTMASHLFLLPNISGGDPEPWYALADFLDLTLQYGNRNSLTTGVDTARDYFFIEKYAMLNNEGSWLVPVMRKNVPAMEEKVAIGPIPFYEEAEKNRLPVELLSLSVTKSSENQQAAEAFLVWLATSREARKYLEGTMGCLTVSGMADESGEELSPIAAEMKEAVQSGKAVLDQLGSLPEELKNGIAELWSRYLTGELDRDTVVREVCALWDQYTDHT